MTRQSRSKSTGGLAWAECTGAGDYPVLDVDFEESTVDTWTPLFFDTGARCNYVSRALLDRLGVPYQTTYARQLMRSIGPSFSSLSRQQKELLASWYFENELQISVTAGGLSYSGIAKFRVVDNWSESTFASLCNFGECRNSRQISRTSYECGYRHGLVAASTLKHLDLQAHLDGVARSTSLVKTGQGR